MGNEEEVLRYYKGKLQIETDPEKILLIFRKLKVVRVTSKHLQVTGILDPLRALRKRSGEVGVEAQNLVAAWKKAPSSHHRSSSQHVDKHHSSSSRSSHSEGSGSNHSAVLNGGAGADLAMTPKLHSRSGSSSGGGSHAPKHSAKSTPIVQPEVASVKTEPEDNEDNVEDNQSGYPPLDAHMDDRILPDSCSSSSSSENEAQHSAHQSDRSKSGIRDTQIKSQLRSSSPPAATSTSSRHSLPPSSSNSNSKRSSSNGGGGGGGADQDSRRSSDRKSDRGDRTSGKSQTSSSRDSRTSDKKVDSNRRKRDADHSGVTTDKKSERGSSEKKSHRESRPADEYKKTDEHKKTEHRSHSSGARKSDKKDDHSRSSVVAESERHSDREHSSVGSSNCTSKREKSDEFRPTETRSEKRISDKSAHSSSERHSKSKDRSLTADSLKPDKLPPLVKLPAHASDREDSASPDQRKSSKKAQVKESSGGDSGGSSSKKSKKALKRASEDGFNATMVSFEDCLGLNDVSSRPVIKKKKANATPPLSSKSSSSSKSARRHNDEKPKVKLEPLAVVKTEPGAGGAGSSSSASPPVLALPEILTKSIGELPSHGSIFSTLPEIQPNYKPMRYSIFDSSPKKNKESLGENANFMSSRHKRTQVFSGRKSAPTVACLTSLVECCVKVLKENPYVMQRCFSDNVEIPPYFLLKPALEKCSPTLLESIENMNDYLLEDSDELWQMHCTREFKGHDPDDCETWRELYSKLGMEREVKFKRITAIISQAQAKKAPERKAIMAFVDGSVKPPRNVARQQARFGTAGPMPIPDRNRVSATAKANMSKHGKTGAAAALATSTSGLSVSVPAAMEPGTSGNSRRSGADASAAADSAQQKAGKKVAPLMQKTLKFMKNRFRR